MTFRDSHFPIAVRDQVKLGVNEESQTEISAVIWVGKKCHVTYKVWSSPLSSPSDTKTQFQCNSAGLFFFGTRGTLHTFVFVFVLFLVCFFLSLV